MEKTFLQKFLETGLFDIGDNDTRLENLESSIKDVEGKLSKDPKLLPRYTLVAIDPHIPDDEPVLVDTETVVSGYWKALRTKYSDRPVHILRGVIINALYNIGKANPKSARIISLTASNFYPYAELNKEAGIVQLFLTELSDIAEEDATKKWALGDKAETIKVSPLTIAGLKFDKIKVDQSALESGLSTAIRNEPGTNYGSNNGGNSSWGQHFAKNAAAAVAAAFTNGLADINNSLSSEIITAPINKFFEEFKNSMDKALNGAFNSVQAVEKRSKLLWWKETLYSTTLKKGYRDLSAELQPIMMAYDLFTLLPAIVPVSVDFLLMDTLRLINSSTLEITFASFLDEVAKEEFKKVAKPFFKEINDHGGRISISDFFTLLIHNRVVISDFYKRTGIDGKRNTTYAGLSVAVLHDLMANNLTTN